ncbi:MAG: hypothetical protein HKM87_06820, partial [Ignavibacteriaceae bacterium]|nr:hypothetical protein [Ignavibacteriaceae bacterium]
MLLILSVWRRVFKTSLIISIILFSFTNSFAQTYNQTLFTYISPKPNSTNNSPANNIIISVNQDLNIGSIYSCSLIIATGNNGGIVSGRIIVKRRTILFIPDNDFLPGDEITVDFSEFGRLLGDYSNQNYFRFSVSEKVNLLTDVVIDEIYRDEIGNGNSLDAVGDSLPVNYPVVSIEKYDDPADGNLFLGIFGGTQYPSLLILENTGNPLFYLETKSDSYDFKKQPNGWLTYFDSDMNKYYALNSNYELVDSFYCGNGFKTDIHELLLLSNNHIYLLGLDPQIIDMSQLVPGGKEDAMVIGFIIQELDENKNVIFQWRSLDYISVLDAAQQVNLTAQVIDYIHTNSVCVDFDGNLIISSRNLNEITKINRQTGELIWRLGGKGNQFSFVNEEYDFYRQHDARRLQNGNILFFDNGNYHIPQFSRAVEYNLDETNFVATKVWEHRNKPDYYTGAMGSARRLSNGNTLINWCRAGFVTEVRGDGSIALELKFQSDYYSYRVFKEEWETTLFTPWLDTLDFGEVYINQSLTKSVVIQSNSEKEITLTGVYNNSKEFSVSTNFPLTIPSFGQTSINVIFSPVETGQFSDTLNIRSDSDSSIVNSQVFASGIGTLLSNADEINIISTY